MYQSTQWEVEQFCTSHNQSVEVIEQDNARFEFHNEPYNIASEFPFCGDPHAQLCTEYPYVLRIPTVEDSPSIEQLNIFLKMNLLHLENEEREEFQDEMIVIPKLNFENSVYILTQATDIEHEPNLEVNEWTRDTMIANRASHFCYDDDDDYDVMLEKHVYAENIAEALGSETLGFSASTFMNDVFSSIPCTCDVDTDLEPVQLFCEDEHDLGKVELSVDTNDLIPENNFDVSNSLLRSQYNSSFDTDLGILDDDDYELGFDNLFYEREHDLPVSELGRVCDGTDNLTHDNSLNVPTSLPMSQTDNLAPNLDFACNRTVKH
ncbi:uncharacterized protein LOC113334932 [Papaver somniferum]|uniref:uncharacterized protein LOC113334932 n=1 Tax=Papaver somniferum TaxID=3469 RepID=UPI000E701AD1|nr:uncharacterized protein LOC113334932 [Papaver somniferum]